MHMITREQFLKAWTESTELCKAFFDTLDLPRLITGEEVFDLLDRTGTDSIEALDFMLSTFRLNDHDEFKSHAQALMSLHRLERKVGEVLKLLRGAPAGKGNDAKQAEAYVAPENTLEKKIADVVAATVKSQLASFKQTMCGIPEKSLPTDSTENTDKEAMSPPMTEKSPASDFTDFKQQLDRIRALRSLT